MRKNGCTNIPPIHHDVLFFRKLALLRHHPFSQRGNGTCITYQFRNILTSDFFFYIFTVEKDFSFTICSFEFNLHGGKYFFLLCFRFALKTYRIQIIFQKKIRSEEHTSELQSLAYLVCRLLLEKKNL